jgi:hypothetical protein
VNKPIRVHIQPAETAMYIIRDSNRCARLLDVVVAIVSVPGTVVSACVLTLCRTLTAAVYIIYEIIIRIVDLRSSARP